MLTVIKKDNTTEEFIDEKIVDAVKKAAFRCDTLIDDEGLARIVSEVRSRLEGRDEVSVLELHELVIAVLSAQQHKQVAEAYAEYRYYKTTYARTFEQLRQDADDVLRLGDRENANYDSSLVSTKGSLIKGYLTKSLYKQFYLSGKEKALIERGDIYIHDLRDMILGCINCCLFDIGHVLKGGFEMSNVQYSEPKSVLSALQVIGDITLVATAQQFGGFTLPELDKVLLPYVEKSLAAARAKGTTVLTNAAREPEIEDLAGYLNRCGAHIHGAGESCIVIEGVPHLYGSTYTVMPDRIAAATGGTVLLRDVNSEHLLPVLSAFESTGCAVMQSGSELLLRAPQRLKPVRHVRTMPYPGFPTDAQAPVMTMAAVGDGTSIFVENIFESRYKHAGELNRLGAKIKLEGKVAVIEGVPQLSGAPVSAEDLRGGAALVIAGLAAQGETQVMHPQYIDRGYAHFEENLRALGADVYRI